MVCGDLPSPRKLIDLPREVFPIPANANTINGKTCWLRYCHSCLVSHITKIALTCTRLAQAVKNIVPCIVNKVNYKSMIHFPSKIPYMVLFIPYMVFVDCIL